MPTDKYTEVGLLRMETALHKKKLANEILQYERRTTQDFMDLSVDNQRLQTQHTTLTQHIDDATHRQDQLLQEFQREKEQQMGALGTLEKSATGSKDAMEAEIASLKAAHRMEQAAKKLALQAAEADEKTLRSAMTKLEETHKREYKLASERNLRILQQSAAEWAIQIESLKGSLLNAQKDKAEQEGTLTKLKHEIERLQQTRVALGNELAQTTAMRHNLNKAREQMKTQYANKVAENAQLTSNLKAREIEITEVENSKDEESNELRLALANVKGQLAEAEEVNRGLLDEQERLQYQFDATKYAIKNVRDVSGEDASTTLLLAIRKREDDSINNTLKHARELKVRAQANIHSLSESRAQVNAVKGHNIKGIRTICKAVSQTATEVDICIVKLLQFYQSTEKLELEMVNVVQQRSM